MMIRSLLLLAASALSLSAGQRLTSSTLWDWRTASDPRISPNGNDVVYVLGWADRQNDAFRSNLWIRAVDGAGARPLTQGDAKDTSPRWSPDGARLAYLSNRSGKPQIYVRWMDTAQEARLTDLEFPPSNIAWSPDGQWIAYTARVPAKPAWSVDMPEKPAGARWADPPIVVTRLRWRNDATGLIRPGFAHVFAVPSAGGAPRQITSGDFEHGAGAPAWSRDSQWLLVSALRIPDADYSLEGPDIHAFHISSGAVKQITRRRGPDTSPTPSPDGKKIAYLGHDFKHQSYTVTHLYVMDSDGENPRQLTATLDRDARNPVWSADSNSIYFMADDHGTAQLYRAGAAGGVQPVTSGVHRLSSSYGAADVFSMSATGRVAAVRSSPLEPADIVTFSVDRPEAMKRLTASNDSLLTGRDVGAVEPLTYGSFDGKPIQGWIIKPPGFDPSRKYPLILDIHGGPHAMYGVEFNHQMQMFAARGFVVLYTNPRGSTGYGEAFGNIIHTRYPGDDYNDLMAGVDALLAKGYIDSKRLAVTGGSGGGLLTAWIIGHTSRFAAAVSQYPVSNWITQVGTADNGYTHAALWMNGMPWEKTEQYLKHSPVFYAANFKTPTMVITGELDFRTPIAESEELYFALKARKVDAVLVRVPDEPHGIRGDHPSHRIAKVEHILGWIEKYTR